VNREELLSRITTFPLLADTLADDFLSGDYRSVFKGTGLEFDEVRRYESGDDVSSIDWNVSARFGVPYVKQYREERELTVAVILDCSASMHSAGSRNDAIGGEISCYEQAVFTAALVAFSAERAGQKVCAILFDHDISRIFPPRKGRAHTMALITAALEAKPQGNLSALGVALAGAGRLLKRRSLLVVVSDFLCINWEHEIGDMARKHDLIAVKIGSPYDRDIPGAGLVTLRDPETGVTIRAPSSFAGFRSSWAAWHEERRRLWAAICKRSGAAALEISTSDDAGASLLSFFGSRRQGMR
jgi:uncharacterized protein (DUF58 family)